MKPDLEKKVLELTGLLCDETITEAQFAELDAILGAEPEARQIYQAYLSMHQKLEDGALAEKQEDSTVVPFHQRREFVWAAAAAAIAIVVTSLSLLRPTTVAEVEPPMAVLTRAIDIEWEHERRFQAEPGQPITEKWLRIKSGLAEVTFSSGATVSIQGPARLRLDSPLYCYSKFGKLAVNCPRSAHGFTVRFNGGKVIDLGTEFALDTELEGNTNVHVLEGEVIVALTDEKEEVVSEQNLLGNHAVALTPGANEIKEINFDASPFASMQRDQLIQSEPIKLQFDLGHRAGVYEGTNSPAHTTGDILAHENVWTQIVGDQSGTFVMADGNLCPHPIKVDYGHGDGKIDWHATPVDPWGKVYGKARGVFKTELCQDHRPWDFDLGLRISGLPAGKYRIYALCRSVRRSGACYHVAFGANLEQLPTEPTVIPPMSDETPKWIDGVTYAADEVEISGPDEWATFITRYSREESIRGTVHHGRSVLLGLQIVEIR